MDSVRAQTSRHKTVFETSEYTWTQDCAVHRRMCTLIGCHRVHLCVSMGYIQQQTRIATHIQKAQGSFRLTSRSTEELSGWWWCSWHSASQTRKTGTAMTQKWGYQSQEWEEPVLHRTMTDCNHMPEIQIETLYLYIQRNVYTKENVVCVYIKETLFECKQKESFLLVYTRKNSLTI